MQIERFPKIRTLGPVAYNEQLMPTGFCRSEKIKCASERNRISHTIPVSPSLHNRPLVFTVLPAQKIPDVQLATLTHGFRQAGFRRKQREHIVVADDRIVEIEAYSHAVSTARKASSKFDGS